MKTKSKYTACLFVVIILLGTLGCKTGSVREFGATKNNYRSELRITLLDRDYYSAKYIADNPGKWFPPITNNIRKRWYESDLNKISASSPAYESIKKEIGKTFYRELNELDIEHINIEMKYPGSPFDKKSKELLHLVAADVALQRGFPYVTRLTKGFDSICVTTQSAVTKGNIDLDTSHSGVVSGDQVYGTSRTSGTYKGKTRLKEDTNCAATIEGEFILFKNKEDIEKGVFVKNRYSGRLDPFTWLYYSTSPNAIIIDHPIGEPIKVNTRKMVIDHAWRNGYKSSGLSSDLRKKYDIDNKEAYIVIDEAEQRRESSIKKAKERSEDPLNRNRINQ